MDAAASTGAADAPDTLGAQDLRTTLRRNAPALAVSLALHALLILLLAFWTLTARDELIEPITTRWASRTATQASAEPPLQAVRIDASGLRGRPAAPSSTPEPPPLAGPAKPVDVSRALSLRSSDASQAPDDVRQAIDAALQWIVRQQQPDGRWMLTGPYPQAGTIDSDSAATALSLLALLGDGQTHQSGRHRAAVDKGLRWLVAQQGGSGDLFDGPSEGLEGHFYAHAMGTICLSEALALSGDEELRPAAERAVAFLVISQNPELGGWRYRPLSSTGVGDLSVTSWCLMALHSARMAGLDAPDETWRLADRFLASVQGDRADGASFRYRPDQPQQHEQRWSMSAKGLLCRQWLGWPADDPAMTSGLAFLTSEAHAPMWAADRRNVYAWYYTAQVLHHLGGEPWRPWFDRTSAVLIAEQDQGTGRTAGSWNPARPRGAFLEWSHGAGRLYLTALCALILETPYRHRAIYEPPAGETSDVDELD
ncbi:MAG: terpene cyclase/mutase family protein [Planctomyces sp.]|nr:terpene cyclase/mutase family protein [Planctomyces sp.]